MKLENKVPLYEADALKYEGISMIVIQPYGKDGSFNLLEYGKGFVPTTLGTILVVPEAYIFQLHKYKIVVDEDWKTELVLKDGETLEELSEFEDNSAVNELKNKIVDARESLKQREIDAETEVKFD